MTAAQTFGRPSCGLPGAVEAGRLSSLKIPLIVPFDPRTDLRQGVIGESVLWPLRHFVQARLASLPL